MVKYEESHTGWKELTFWCEGVKYTNGKDGYPFPSYFKCFPETMTLLGSHRQHGIWLCEVHYKQAVERGYLW